MKHLCKEAEGALFTIENRGEGWYLYTANLHGEQRIKFCPCCGKKVEDFEGEQNGNSES